MLMLSFKKKHHFGYSWPKDRRKGEPYLLRTAFYSNYVWPIVIHLVKKEAHYDPKLS